MSEAWRPLLLALLVVGYMLPALIAAGRGHHQAGAIFVLNLFLGWMFLGWVPSLVWAASAIRRER